MSCEDFIEVSLFVLRFVRSQRDSWR